MTGLFRLKEPPETGINVLIMGVGRSGTTAVYALLQEILEDVFPGDVDYVYEPFLWDRRTFNKPYKDLTDEFRYSTSVSIEGMYHHKRIPLLVGESSPIDPQSQVWLKETLTARGGKRHYLGKMIRANGRLRLIRELTPNTKIIFLIRNPVDVLNSAFQLFSFFGSESHTSDFERFSTEVTKYFGNTLQRTDPELKCVASQYSYWYFMNRAFLEYTNLHSEGILKVAYEEFENNRSPVVKSICEFLGVPYKHKYTDSSQERIGAVKNASAGLSKAEFEYLVQRLEVYQGLLGYVSSKTSVSAPGVVKTISWCGKTRTGERQAHYNAYYSAMELSRIAIELEMMHSKVGALEQDLSRTQQSLSDLISSRRLRAVNWILSPWDKLRKRSVGKSN